MTLPDWESEIHHRGGEVDCQSTQDVLFPTFSDWTLFPEEEPALLTPKSSPTTSRAKIPGTAKSKAQRQNQENIQQRKASERTSRKSWPKPSKQDQNENGDQKMNCGASLALRGDEMTETIDSPMATAAGFELVLRTSRTISAYAQVPTPPIEGTDDMFAPIEMLGEDLRWYEATKNATHKSQ